MAPCDWNLSELICSSLFLLVSDEIITPQAWVCFGVNKVMQFIKQLIIKVQMELCLPIMTYKAHWDYNNAYNC